VIDEISDIRKIIAEQRDSVQTSSEGCFTKIKNTEEDIERKREKEEELNDALRKLDHLQGLKDKLKEMIQKEAEQKNVDPEAGKKKKKEKKK
jgi:hypothetical protein